MKEPYITVTSGMSGWFAILVSWDPECGEMLPDTTGMGRYRSRREAIAEGQTWAAAEELKFELE